jgi:hypothetical protein
VAAVLAVSQVGLCALAIAGEGWGPKILTAVALAAVGAGIAVIIVLDTTRWRPPDIAVGDGGATSVSASPVLAPTDQR